MNENLYSVLESSFPEDRDKSFIITANNQVISYGAMMDETARLANGLVGLGLKRGDRVAVQVEKSIDALFLYLATVRAGGVFLPLNPAYTSNEVSYFLTDARPHLLVCRPETEHELRSIGEAAGVVFIKTLSPDGQGSLLEGFKGCTSQFSTVECQRDDLAAILYTSGTTGRSKGAMLSHGNLSSNASVLKDVWQFTQRDVLLHALPIFHTHGLFTATNTILAAGASMIWLNRFDTDKILELIGGATSMMGVPTFYSRLLQHPEFNALRVEHMRLFISGSAPLSPEVHSEFSKRTGHAILERYGMTETSMNTSNPYRGERRAGTVGFPLPGVEIRITDPVTGEPLNQGEVGMIEIRGPNVFKGYWEMPEKTAEDIRESGFFVSGDLGKIDNDGYVHIVGREKDLIISGGFNVYPAEVEAAIDAIPGVAECAVIGLPHPDFGEGVTAIVACQENTDLAQEVLVAKLEGELARFKQPKSVIFVSNLPRNSMGKIQKKELREKYKDAYLK